MNLRDLEYIVALAQEKHFGRTAQRCHVSQPALSAQIKKLEDYLQIQLFERTTKEVRVTPAGAEIVERAARILEEAKALEELAESFQNPFAGELTLGLFPTLAQYILPRLVRELRRSFPELSCYYVEDKTPELTSELVKGNLDAALLSLPINEERLEAVELFREPFLLGVSREHPLAKRKSVRLSDFDPGALMLLDDGHCLKDQTVSFCQLKPDGVNEQFPARSLETLRAMTASGLAVALSPRIAIDRRFPGVAYIPFRERAPERRIALAWRKSSGRKELFQALAEALKRLL